MALIALSVINSTSPGPAPTMVSLLTAPLTPEGEIGCAIFIFTSFLFIMLSVIN